MTNLTQVPMYTSFDDLVSLAVDYDFPAQPLDCSITLHVDGVEHQAYHVDVSYRDLMFTTDKGTVTYLVDTYGDTTCAELYTWELDD